MKMQKRHTLAMAALIALGALGTATVLWRSPAASGTEAGHDHARDGGHRDEHADKHGDKPGTAEAGTVPSVSAGSAPGWVAISEAQQQAAGIQLDTVRAAELQAVKDFNGELRLDEDRTAHIVPGVSGIVLEAPARLGQTVRRGELLAVVKSSAVAELRSDLLTAKRRLQMAQLHHERERQLWADRISAEQDHLQAQAQLREAEIQVQALKQKLEALGATASAEKLNRLEIRAPLDGSIVEKHLSRGEALREDASIFTLADTRTVWAEFAVTAQDLALVRVGQKVQVSSTALEGRVAGRVAYVGALLGEQSRSARARVLVDNPQGLWRPGLFVTVSVQGPREPAALTVAREAVQTIEGRSTVFRQMAGGFQAVSVQTGRADAERIEILAGLQAGDRVAGVQSQLLKSELGKASAEHQH